MFYQHPANLILSSTQSTETSCKSQATSPVTCLTPPPETAPPEEEIGVQDASNQTDCLEEEEIKSPKPEKKEEIHEVPEQKENKPDISGLELLSNSIVEFEKMDVPIKYEEQPKETELLNGIAHMTIKDKENELKNIDDNLGGLNLLCALAEQRLEEVLEKQNEEDYKHYKQYKKPKDLDEPKIKKTKYNSEIDLDEEKSSILKKVTGEKVGDKIGAIEKTDSRTECREEEEDNYISAEEMRVKLKDLERKYKEKQLEFTKPECEDCTKRQKAERSPSPPLLDKMDSPVRHSSDLLKPPVLTAVEIKPEEKPDLKRKSDSGSSTPEKISSSKKRKVGRPKKLITPNLKVQTETIVAKKPRKNGIVGFLLAAKNRLQMQTKGVAPSKSPPRYVEEPTKKVKTQKKITKCSEFKKKRHKNKIRPKLKAEPKMKKVQEEEECSEWEVSMPVEEVIPVSIFQYQKLKYFIVAIDLLLATAYFLIYFKIPHI